MCKKSVLISIQPRWCELIASDKKTIEVRKTRPKRKTPFKVYIYETKNSDTIFSVFPRKPVHLSFGRGMIIGEFVCDRVYDLSFLPNEYYGKPSGTFEQFICENSCLSFEDIKTYGNGKNIYGWHISDLVIYDKPRELSEFYVEGDCDCMNCKKCAWFDNGNGYNVEDDCSLAYKGIGLHKSFKPIIRPPQSWCYVESEDTE